MSDLESGPFLVSGASGKMGSQVVNELLNHHKIDPQLIIATSRTPEALGHLAELGVSVRQADFADPASLRAAFAGARRALIIPTLSIDVPGRRLEEHINAVEACAGAGVEHITFVSSNDFTPQSPVPYVKDYWGTEERIKASDMSWTILRDCLYMDNWEMYLPSYYAMGEWPTCNKGRRLNLVLRADCARSAAVVLATKGHDSAEYILTGPEALTVSEMADIASDVIGRPIAAVEVSNERYGHILEEIGEPKWLADIHITYEVSASMGRMEIVTEDVKRLTGRRATTFREYMIANKDKFPAEFGYGNPCRERFARSA